MPSQNYMILETTISEPYATTHPLQLFQFSLDQVSRCIAYSNAIGLRLNIRRCNIKSLILLGGSNRNLVITLRCRTTKPFLTTKIPTLVRQNQLVHCSSLAITDSYPHSGFQAFWYSARGAMVADIYVSRLRRTNLRLLPFKHQALHDYSIESFLVSLQLVSRCKLLGKTETSQMLLCACISSC